MLHGGLQINLKQNQQDFVYFQHCCLRSSSKIALTGTDLWNHPSLIPLRELNDQGKWDPGCWTCQGNELAGLSSFRTSMIEKFGDKRPVTGPQRLDLMFDISCNLACRSCGPGLSTFWQQHLKENNISFHAPKPDSRVDDMIELLSKMDLSNLRMVVFCGGETLLGQGYWRVAKAIADMVPNAKNQLEICFQTNGTQSIAERNYEIIEKINLVKLHVSLDGIGEQFEYLRWPASWQQVSENIINLRDNLPANVMFTVEETYTIFNLFYRQRLQQWLDNNFSTNRLGDVTSHTQHIAVGIFGLENLTKEYIENLTGDIRNIINPNWKESPEKIAAMIKEIEKFDAIRGQSWQKTFPEVAGFYSRYLK